MRKSDAVDGMRVKLTDEALRSGLGPQKHGRITGRSRLTCGVRVVWDGQKTVHIYHASFVQSDQ